MADVKSTQITNLDATPQGREPAYRDGGYLKESTSTVVTAADQSASDFLFYVRVPTSARVSQVLLSCADASSTGAIDIGLFSRSVDGAGVVTYTAIDDDLFASAVDLTGGPMKNLDVTNESDEYSLAEQEKPLWEVLGLTADPGGYYYVGSDITTVFSGGPLAINLKVRYVE